MQKGSGIRRRARAFVLFVCCLALCGCGAGSPLSAATPSPVPSPTLSPTPAPSPTPVPVIAVFGAEASGAFAREIRSAAKKGAYEVDMIPGYLDALASFRPEGGCVAVVLLSGAEDALPETDFPLFVFASGGQTVSPRIPALTYQDDGAVKAALDYAVAYPPHETPVRLIGLFMSAESGAYALWKEQSANGRVFSKAELFLTETAEGTPAPGETAPSPSPTPALETRLTSLFSKFYPGMIDGVFAETGGLAVAAAEALASLGRDDIEVFSASTSANAQALLSPLLVFAAGVDYGEAGGLCYSAACALIEGTDVPRTVLQPVSYAFSAAD